MENKSKEKRVLELEQVRMAEGDIQKIRKTARRADMEIGEFAREAMEKAVKEKEADLQRLKKK